MTLDEDRRAAIAAVERERGEPLTADEAAALPDGARVLVIWSGGNGPHEGVIVADEGDPTRYYVPLHLVNDERMRHYNPLELVGVQRFHTRVWLLP